MPENEATTPAETKTEAKSQPIQQQQQASTPSIDDAARKAIADEAIERFRKEQEATDAEAKRIAKEEADREKGKFKDLYEGEQKKLAETQAKAVALELDLKRSRIEMRLRDHVQAVAPEYASAVRYMNPLLTIDQATKDDAADKQIKEIVEQYVKDNPRAKSSGTLPPIAKVGTGNASKSENGLASRIQNRLSNV